MSFEHAKGLHKTLFRKILLSHFPKKSHSIGMQPANMFVSFISPRQFFSIVNRKIVENYKLNYFDTSLDPFEIKIGFGNAPGIKVKNIEYYYAYCAAANMNGYKTYTPSMIGNALSMCASAFLYQYFPKNKPSLFQQYISAIYLLSYIFFARVRVFPHTNDPWGKYTQNQRQENFNRFVELFFSFYEFLCTTAKIKFQPKDIQNIKKKTLKEVGFFFFLYEVYLLCSTVFVHSSQENEKELYQRLFQDHKNVDIHSSQWKKTIDLLHQRRSTSSFGQKDLFACNNLFPTDFLTKYLFEGKDGFLIAKHLFGTIFDNATLQKEFDACVKGKHNIEKTLQYLLSYKNFQQYFFEGMKDFLEQKFQGFDEEESSPTSSTNDDTDETMIEDLMSYVGDFATTDDDEMFDDEFEIPARLKEESDVVEKMLNFYITFVGGFGVSRGDTGFLKLFKQEFLREIFQRIDLMSEKEKGLEFFGSFLYLYNKNNAYYKYVEQNIRSGKERFKIPFKSVVKKIQSNIFLIELFNTGFIATMLQDIVPSDVKIYLTHKKIMEIFQDLHGKEISYLVNLPNDQLIMEIYEPYQNLLRKKIGLLNLLKRNITKNDIHTLKSHLYTLDFWLMNDMLLYISEHLKQKMWKCYADPAMMGIISGLRETVSGLFLYLSFLQDNLTDNKEIDNIADIYHLIQMYLLTVINVDESLAESMTKGIYKIYKKYKKILQIWHQMDDNPMFFSLGYENRLVYRKNIKPANFISSLNGEDILRFRGYLKNATYYNKRYLIPSYTSS